MNATSSQKQRDNFADKIIGSVMHDINDFTQKYPSRRSGSRQDHSMAKEIYQRFLKAGLSSELQTVNTYGGSYVSYCFHCVLGLSILFLNIFPEQWFFGLLFSLFVSVSFVLELNGRAYILRKLLPRLPTYNVIGYSSRPNAKHRIVVSGHHDAGYCGKIYKANIAKPQGNRSSIWNFVTLPASEPHLFAVLAVMLMPLGIPLFHTSLPLLHYMGFVWQAGWSLYLVLYLYLFSEVAGWGPVSPSANDNATGVATMLAIAEHRNELDQCNNKMFEWWFVSTGADEQGGMGIRRLLTGTATAWHRDNTLFVFFDTTGRGEPHYLLEEGILWPKKSIPEVSKDLIQKVVSSFSDLGQIKSHRITNTYSDMLPVWRAGFQGCMFFGLHPEENFYHTIQDLAGNIDPEAVKRIVKIGIAFIHEYQNLIIRRDSG